MDNSQLDALALHAVLLVAVVSRPCPKPAREPSHFQQRLNWKWRSDEHARRGTFEHRLRMSKVSFDNLLGLLRMDLLANEEQAAIRGGPTLQEVCLHCTLWWLVGGLHLDIIDTVGMSKPSFCRALWKTMRAICDCDELDITFRTAREQVDDAIRGFTSTSWQSATNDCAAVVDGFLLCVNTPPKQLWGTCALFSQAIASVTGLMFRWQS